MGVLLNVLLLLCLFSLDKDWEQVVKVREHLHRHPELSNREFKTRAFLEAELRKLGFESVETMAKTGLRVVYDTGRPGPVLAFRADIDALPVEEKTGLPFASENKGVMHACGHDMHTAILFGAAQAIRKDPEINGKIVFLFQPAEEGPPPNEEGGAPLMITDGALEKPKPAAIFGLHVLGRMKLGQVGYRTGGILARADRFTLRIKGRQAHGSAPEKGIDPIFIGSEIVSAAQSVVSRRTDPRDPVVVTFGTFDAGTRFNIIPAEATLTGTIRTLRVETGDRVPQYLGTMIEGITQAHGASYEFKNEMMCPSTQNDREWTEKTARVLTEASFDMVAVDPLMAAEDFAYYAQQIPGVYLFLGACEGDGECSDIHQPDFVPAEKTMRVGIRLFTTLARHFSQEQL